jgi:RimJ/RimL family protein N-acetyltransferase
MMIEPLTARLRLRQWKESDREPFAAMNADPLVMEHFPSLLSRAESDAGIDRQIAHIENFGWGFWAVETLAEKQFIGFVGIKHVTDDMPFAPAVEIGWRLAKKSWGKGFATEAASACLQIGFEQLGLQEIVSFRAVMEKLAMRHSENFFHPALPQGHPMQEHVLYRLQAGSYVANS